MASQTNNEGYNVDLFYDAVLNLVNTAGELIKEKTLSRNKLIEIKSNEIDLVTETDKEVEKLLIDGLSNQFPDHKFIGEESVSSGNQCSFTNHPTWIIDPIDGTMNFVHSFPHSCLSIALFINRTPEIAIIYNPMLNQKFIARKGKGAFLNGDAIAVSGKTSLSETLIMLEFGTSREEEKYRVIVENQKVLMPKVHGKKFYNPEDPREAEELLNYLEEVNSNDEIFNQINDCERIDLVFYHQNMASTMIQMMFRVKMRMNFLSATSPDYLAGSKRKCSRNVLNEVRLRALGSAALNMAMVACGAADAYFEFGIHIWDIAAGELLVTEAGGVIMDPAGGEIDRLSRRVLVAGSQELAEKLSQELIQYYPSPTD